MNRTIHPILPALLGLLATAGQAMGWGGEGHQVTALIAERHLTPAARAQITALLGPDVDISDAEVANWADRIRRDRKDTGGYHYVDIPVDAKGYDAARDGNNGDNVIDKLAFYEGVLKDRSKPKAEREEALRWVVHLVGDLHQPLHCAERDKDRGGNARMAFLLDAKGPASNLHSIWDTGIPRLIVGRQPLAQYAATLDKRVTEKSIETWSKSTPIDWANAGQALAVKVVYDGVPADGPPPRLDQKYVDRAKPVIEDQWAKGGARLATILNRALAGKPAR